MSDAKRQVLTSSTMKTMSVAVVMMSMLVATSWSAVLSTNDDDDLDYNQQQHVTQISSQTSSGSGSADRVQTTSEDVQVSGSCPPALDRLPQCECRDINWRAYVVCTAVPVDLERLRKALLESANATSLWLRVDGSDFPLLAQRAFGGLSLHSVQINASNVSQVTDDAFVDMGHLRFLGLQDNQLTVVPVPALRRLIRLEMLSLAGNRITAVPPAAFVALPGLRYLSLSQNAIATVERGSFGKGLRHLALSSNHLSSLNGSVRFLPHLEWLLLSGNRLSAVGDDDFDHLPALTHLHLADNRLSSVRGAFVRLPRLHVLNMGRNMLRRIDYMSFEGLHSLTELDLSGNLLEAIDAAAFKDLNSLLALDLADNRLSSLNGATSASAVAGGTRELSPGNENNNKDDVDNYTVQIYDGFLNSLVRLKRLNLSGNMLETIDGEDFAQLPALRDLDLSRNRIITIGRNSPLSLPALQSVWLEGNQVSSIGPTTFIGLPGLHELDVRQNALTRLPRDTFAHNPDLRMLKIQGNPWACDNHLVRVLLQLEANLTQIDDKPWCMNAVVQLEGP